MAKEENRTSHSNAISVTVLLSGKAAHPQAMTAAAAAMTRAMVTSNLRLKGPPAAALGGQGRQLEAAIWRLRFVR